MKILIPAFYLERKMRRGVETMAYETIHRMVKARPNHEFVLLYYNDPVLSEFDNVKNIKISNNIVINILWEFRRIFHKENCDAFFSPGQYTYFGKQINTVAVALDVAWKYFPEYFPFRIRVSLEFLMRRMTSSTAKIAAISASTAADVQKFYNVHPDRVQVILLGYDQERFSPSKESKQTVTLSGYSIMPNFILFVGTLQKRKNLINLIQAFEIAPSCKNLNLVLAGTPGWFYEEVRDVIDRSPAKNRIIETGYISEQDKVLLYQNAKITVMPSLYEGFGIPLLESMACGTPVIAANISSMPEVVGSDRYLFDPFHIDSIASKLDYVLDDQNYAEARLHSSKQCQKFTWESTAQKILSMLETP